VTAASPAVRLRGSHALRRHATTRYPTLAPGELAVLLLDSGSLVLVRSRILRVPMLSASEQGALFTSIIRQLRFDARAEGNAEAVLLLGSDADETLTDSDHLWADSFRHACRGAELLAAEVLVRTRTAGWLRAARRPLRATRHPVAPADERPAVPAEVRPGHGP
jgi:hypothetical protein